MEFWYMVTGAMHQVKLHEIHMQGQDFFINATAHNGQKFQQQMKGALEPIQLYRYIFPKEALPVVQNTLNTNTGHIPNGLNLQAWALRKAFKLDKVPEQEPIIPKMHVHTDHLQIIPIGIKPDPEGVIPATGVDQEKL